MNTSIDQDDSLSIAVIGMVGRFPEAKNLDEFWANLRNGVEGIRHFSDEELLEAGVDAGILRDKNYVKSAALLSDIELFDANFFGITPRDAEITDPQQRLFLEAAWEALEHAGYGPGTYDGAVGIYAGTSRSTYFFENILQNSQVMQSAAMMQLFIGNEKDTLACHAAYHMNLHGPAVTVQTACSTSLVAVHLACQSILNGECDMALAGGVSVGNLRKQGYFYMEGGISSPDGHCRAFDAQSAGTVGGNGIGIVVVKSLASARADGDTIYAVIRGSAVNNDGADKVGFTAPSINGQAAVITEALAVAGVAAESISYIEAHGTGTILGDPIEMKALQQAFSLSTDKKQFCAVGSLKTNIGHLDTAAGVSGLIKTVLALKNKEIPPSLHFTRPNPHIDFANSPFYVNASLAEWHAADEPRRAGVSSFGIGGTNAHVIVEEAPVAEASGVSRSSQLLLLSAKTPAALETATANLKQFFIDNPETNLADAAYTAQIGRQHFNYRRMVVCDSIDTAVNNLIADDPAQPLAFLADRTAYSLVFMFPGQGAQYPNMAKELYQSEEVFRSEVDTCAELLRASLGLDLRNVLFPQETKLDEATVLLNQTQITQPALFVIEYALARQFNEWGIQPAAMVGHSIGEYVAACLAGVFSLPDALVLVAQRGKLIASLPTGTMIAVHASEQTMQSLLAENLWIAAVNAPSICSVSGTADAIEKLSTHLREQNIHFQALHTSHAFHSGMMDPILDEFAQRISKIKLHAPSIPYVSNVSGTWITAEQATSSAYWVKHLRQPVRFSDCLDALMQKQTPLLLEVGPGRTLSSLVKQHAAKDMHPVALSTLPSAKSHFCALEAMLNALGKLWLHGMTIDWKQFYRDEKRHRIALPTYPFERKRYWIEPSKIADVIQPAKKVHHGKRENIAEWFYTPSWKRSVESRVRKCEKDLSQDVHLVFADRHEIGARFIESLRKDSGEMFVVTQGSDFSAENGIYIIDSTKPEHYERLLSELVTQNRVPSRITHFWGLTPSDPAFPISQHDGFYSLLFMAQAFVKVKIISPLVINVVSNGVHAVIGNEVLFPDKATILGPCQVLPIESPNVKCRHIDFDGTHHISDTMIRLFAQEINADISDLTVAYRGSYRWTRAFEPVNLSSTTSQIKLRDNGHYLITGGLGGIGLTFAQYLASKVVQPKITLVGRSSFPDRETWSDYLATHKESDSISQKIRQIRSLEERGAEVLYIAADIVNEDEVRHIQQITSSAFGRVHGIFHAAGLSGTEPRLDHKTYETASIFMAPKLIGTRLLEQVFELPQLDFLMLCSSVSAIAPTVGHIDYSAVNAFLDAYAQERKLSQIANVIAVNWSTWQGVGMAVKDFETLSEDEREQRELYLTNCISTQDAPQIFDLLLSTDLAQIMVTPVDFDAMLKGTVALNAVLSNQSNSSANHVAPQGARPNLATAYAAPRTEIEKTLANIWQDLFGIVDIGIYDDFFDLGGHSLLATQVISKVRSEFQIDLPLRALFEAPSIAILAEQVNTAQERAVQIQNEKKSALVMDVKKSLDAMSPDELAAMLAEKRRLKAIKQQKAI